MSESKDKEAAQADRDVQAEVQKVSDALGDTGRILVRPKWYGAADPRDGRGTDG